MKCRSMESGFGIGISSKSNESKGKNPDWDVPSQHICIYTHMHTIQWLSKVYTLVEIPGFCDVNYHVKY